MNAVALTSGMRRNLSSLQNISKLCLTNSVQMNTGKKVNSALDSPVAFFTAVEHANRAKDLMLCKAEMGEGIQTIRAASNGIDTMLDLIGSAESIAQSALSAKTPEEVETLANQYNETLNQITAVANDACYKGIGLLRCPPESLTVDLDEDGTSSIALEGECATAEGLGVNEVGNLSTEEAQTVGGEFGVNTTNVNSQARNDAAPFSDGGFVVTWLSEQSGSQEIYYQLYDRDGNKVGSEIKANTNPSNTWYPSVAVLSDDKFVITWSSDYEGDMRVYAQLYDRDGNELGTEFQANTTTLNTQDRPDVRAFTDSGFVVAWRSNHTGDYKLYCQEYDSEGNPVGNEYEETSSLAASQAVSRVAELSDGSYVVVRAANLTGATQIYGQVYDIDGNPLGGEFQLNTNSSPSDTDPTYRANEDPCVTALADGGFVVVWEADHSGDFGIYGQQYDKDYKPVGGEFQINTNTPDYQIHPYVIGLSDGGFAVTWDSNHTGDWDVYGQRYMVPDVSEWNVPENIQTSLNELSAAKQHLRTLQQKFSNNLSIITTRSSFTDSMVNILQTGSDNLTNADINETAANALMLQTRRSLSTTSLSMAGQAAQSVLRLFS